MNYLSPLSLGERISTVVTNSKKNIREIIISDDREYYVKSLNDSQDLLSPVRSMCKFVTSLCVGKMLNEYSNQINLHTQVWPIICSSVDLPCNKDKKDVTMHHLLIQSSGFSDPYLLSSLSNIEPWRAQNIEYLANIPVDYIPGTKFVYSNASYYLLSVLIQIITKKTLNEYANEHIFSPLGINDYRWEKFGNYTAGATGLKIKGTDYHNLFTSFLGTHSSQLYCSQNDYLKKMIEPQIKVPSMSNPLSPRKYCYSLWWVNDSIRYISGADGQYHIWDSDRQLSITLISNEQNIYDILAFIRKELQIEKQEEF